MHCSRIMAPNHHFMLNPLPLEPVSRTYQYRKIMKPMLERKRRARINKCLDELKDLMTGTLQADGENVSKLEKADILELTVRHLQRLREHNALFLRSNETLNMEKFWAGFQHCAVEVSQFLSKYDQSISGDLVKHMASYIPNVPAAAAAAAASAAAASAAAATVAHTNANNHNISISNGNVAAATYRRLSAGDMPHAQHTTRHRQGHAAGGNEYKATSKSKLSTTRQQLQPYARPAAATATAIATTALAAPSHGSAEAKAEPCAGVDVDVDDDADAGVWRPW